MWAILGGLTGCEQRALAQSDGWRPPEIITQRQGLPQGFVPSIVQDRQGFIWVGTLAGLGRYDGTNFKTFQSVIVHELKPDAQGRLWIRSEHDLDRFDPATETFYRFTHQPLYQKNIQRDSIRCFFVDNQNRLWMSPRAGGLLQIDLRTNHYRWFRHQPGQPGSLSHPLIRQIVQDRQGRIWLATEAGLDRLDESADRFVHYPFGTPNGLPDASLLGLYARTNGDLLLATEKHLTVYQTRTGTFKAFKLPKTYQKETKTDFATDSQGNDYVAINGLYRFDDTNGVRLLTDPVGNQSYRCIYIDRSDVLWVGTNGDGVLKFNLRASLFQTIRYRDGFQADLFTRFLGLPAAELPPALAKGYAYNFRSVSDRHGKLWVSVGTSGVYQLDLRTKKWQAIPLPETIGSGPAMHPVLLTIDLAGHIWLGHHLKAWRYNEKQHTWELFPWVIRPKADSQRVSLQMVVDHQAIWVITGSNGLFRTDRKTGQLHHFTHRPGDSASLSSNLLTCLVADPSDSTRLWVGTFGAGLCRFDKRTGRSICFSTKTGLPNDVIYSVLPDRKGFLWVATNQGLGRLNQRTLQTHSYTYEDGLLAEEFNRFHQLQLPDGRLALGGLEGITAFDSRQIRDDSYHPPVQITDILINNKAIEAGELTQNRTIHTVSTLNLKHNQNFVTVHFAAMQFNRHDKIRFRYQLEGLDAEWIETERPLAVYTDLRPGEYTLKLNASNTSGIWSPHVRRLSMIVQQPWWTTWWALSGYTLILVSIGYIAVRSYLNRLQLRQLQSLDAMKTRFFSNITHEFRTPIALIMTPAEQLLNRLQEPEDRKRLYTINRNANQLLDLVNQLLDLSKLEAGAIKVEEARGNLAELVGTMVQSFQAAAEARGIELRYETVPLSEEYWFDTGKLERIVTNLIANALKFTQTGGRVECRLSPLKDPGSDGILLTVSDSGIGIAPDHLPHIFDRFYQVEDSVAGLSAQKQQGGTGIGLSLVKEFVELQGGTIRVKSGLGTGTTFTVSLPYRPAVSSVGQPNEAPTPLAREADAAIHLLIVEDNQELAMYIAESFPDSYRIIQASNGAEGLALALGQMPDLIISDVLMPVMDGYTLVRKLKADIRLNHIPVILLTAKSAYESRVEGLKAGANDYITKPFHMEELRLRVRNLLDQQRQYREWIRGRLTNPDTAPMVSSPESPEPFFEILYPVLEKNLDNPHFGVEELSHELRLSRTGLYRKMKTLTGLSTNEVIRNYRLKRATQYLRQGLNSSETAYQVGFDSPAYFTKCFRDFYQMTPMEFVTKGGIASWLLYLNYCL
ncbi:ATP-binding protein [Larkinella bovis]|uniref:histidine kinase n=1 Tax=Larkinella bovis TaxID=683041 RepID=A0ABW0I852_9BACT